jgi:hypothetical protein
VRGSADARPFEVSLRGEGAQWLACGLPANETLVLWSGNEATPVVHSRFRVPAGVGIALISGSTEADSHSAEVDARAERRPLLVVSSRDSAPLTNVTVVVDGRYSYGGDSRGVVRVGVSPTSRELLVRRLGYLPKTLAVDSARPAPDTVLLEPIPVNLREVVIQGRRISAPERYADVLRRAASGSGVLLTRNDLQGTRDLRTALNQIPGVQLTDRGITMQRCEGGMPSPGREFPEARIQVYIDGVRVTMLPAENAILDALRLVHPRSIELVEVYRGVAQIPAEFVNDACAVIAIWTRSY